jgi:hypothetical protein
VAACGTACNLEIIGNQFIFQNTDIQYAGAMHVDLG